MDRRTIAVLATAPCIAGCAVALPDKPPAPMIVIAVEQAPPPETTETAAYAEPRKPPVPAPEPVFSPDPQKGTEYAFECATVDAKGLRVSGVVTLYEGWVFGSDAYGPIPIMDFDTLTNHAVRSFERKTFGPTPSSAHPTACLFKGLTLENLIPVWPESP